jgi:UrcA family protein
MSTRRILHRIRPIALAAGLCLTVSALAADELPPITIGAGVMTKTQIGRSSSGLPTEQVTVTHRVSYKDLDLTKEAGAAELKKRVKATAHAACKQLDELYPLEAKNVQDCTRITFAKATPQVENAIALANRQAKAGPNKEAKAE